MDQPYFCDNKTVLVCDIKYNHFFTCRTQKRIGVINFLVNVSNTNIVYKPYDASPVVRSSIKIGI